jgi:hypothetical protein
MQHSKNAKKQNWHFCFLPLTALVLEIRASDGKRKDGPFKGTFIDMQLNEVVQIA